MKTKNKAEIYNSPEMDEILNEISPAELKRTRNRMLLAAKIDDAIGSKGWKKTDFARKIGKNPSEITKWLSGTHNFTIDTLSDIEDLLGINLVNVAEKENEVYLYFSGSVQSDSRPEVGFPWLGGALTKPNESLIIYQSGKLLSMTDLSINN
jgi:transcriptional regulator with XRE-family HTH domain